MADFLKNNPIALRHCLFYEFLQKHSVEHTVNMFWVVVRKDVINKKEAHFWFNQFTQGIFDINSDNKPITDMRDVLRSDKYALRACILYESLKYKLHECMSLIQYLWPMSNLSDRKIERSPSFSMYNNFCDVVGDNVMEYREFDVWFYRFVNGKFDLNFEEDKEKKIHELIDMPLDVMVKVVEYLDILDRINLTKTSRSLESFVGDQKLFQHYLKLYVSNNTTRMSFGDSANCRKSFKIRRKRDRGVDHWKHAFLDFKSILKNPKLHLNTLEIELDIDSFYSQYFESLQNVFNDLEDALKFTHHLKVKNLKLVENSGHQLSRILPFLKPGYLTTIVIDSLDPNVDSMKILFEMEQWKQAKRFDSTGDFFVWPLHHLYHFKEFHVDVEELFVEDVRQMKDILFKSPDFEKCLLYIPREIDLLIFDQEFGNALREHPYITYHYSIPNSTDYFEIKVERRSIGITKMKL